MKALRQLEYGHTLVIQYLPIPIATEGTAVVKILSSSVLSYVKDIYNGQRKYPYSTPLTTGTSAIGRVHDVGPDATTLREGQLVLVDCFFRARDQPDHGILCAIAAGHSDGSAKLFDHWRNGSYAEFQAVPLENTFALDEETLFGKFQYTVFDLNFIPRALVPWGGLMDINLRSGETIIIAPATGGFGSAAVHCALALGARVIAMGRNLDVLARLQAMFNDRFPQDRLVTVPITGVFEEEVAALKSAAGRLPINAYLDIGPREAAHATYLKAAIHVMGYGGRISLMGGQRGDVAIPYNKIMRSNLVLKGRWMYERRNVLHLLKLVEVGVLPLGPVRAGIKEPDRYTLDEWERAFTTASEGDPLSGGCVLIP